MGLLREATDDAALAKVGIMGLQGSGKTFTSTLIAIGLHKHIGSKKPVAFLSTEPGVDYVKHKFTAAGVKLLVAKTKSFVDALTFMDEAERASDIFIIDSATHLWVELCASHLRKINSNRRQPITKLEFQHWAEVKSVWSRFTDRFLDVKCHAIVCGRLGYVYEFQKEDEDSKKELVKVATKMKAEGEFGYEPSLLIEMDKIQTGPNLGPSKKAGTAERLVRVRAFVHKDRFDTIDGMMFEDPTFENFLPHFSMLHIGGAHVVEDPGKSSEGLFSAEGNGEWTREKRARERWCEEIAGLFTMYKPGQTASEKAEKAKLLQEVFGTTAWTAIQNTRSDAIRAGYYALKAKVAPDGPDPVEAVEAGETTTEGAE
jgi:hypothetical protein